MKSKMTRLIFQRQMHAAESMDHSAAEIYPDEVIAIMRALARANHAEAALRKLALKSLWRTCGRSSETSFMHYDGLKWNTLFRCATVECPQSKSSKVKVIPLVAGATRHHDWFVDFGDHLVMEHGAYIYQPGEMPWLIPEIHGSSAGAKLTGFVKALQIEGKPVNNIGHSIYENGLAFTPSASHSGPSSSSAPLPSASPSEPSASASSGKAPVPPPDFPEPPPRNAFQVMLQQSAVGSADFLSRGFV